MSPVAIVVSTGIDIGVSVLITTSTPHARRTSHRIMSPHGGAPLKIALQVCSGTARRRPAQRLRRNCIVPVRPVFEPRSREAVRLEPRS